MLKTIVKLTTSALLTFAISSAVQAAPVDLSGWLSDGDGNWTLQSQDNPNDSVLQTLNSKPTVFFNNTNSQGIELSGTIEVQTTADDDLVGFVLGYDDGDLTGDNLTANYILIDWKQYDQSGWAKGMTISRVTGSLCPDSLGRACGGTTTAHDAWSHTGNVTEIARATNLGNIGWSDNTEYDFDIVFTSGRIQVFIDGALEFDITGSFENGSFGFYNYSQQSVRYASLTTDPSRLPEPSTLAVLGLGLSALGFAARRRKKRS